MTLICLTLYLLFYSLFVKIMLPTISPLFPYTTLFRSNGCGAGRKATGRDLPAQVGPLPPARRAGKRLIADVPGDRKSTRLNSSHLVISYAVFCLKKKK